MIRSLIIFTLLISPSASLVAQEAPIAVKSIKAANTHIGMAVALQLKKEIENIDGLTIVSPGTAFALELEILSVSFENKPMSVYNVSWYVNFGNNPYFKREYLVSDVGYVGATKIKSIARELKQKTLKLVTAYQNVVQKILNYEKNKR